MVASSSGATWVDAIDRWLVVDRVRFVSAAMLAVMGGLWFASALRGEPAHDVFGDLLMPDLLAHLTGGSLVRTGQVAQLYDIDAQRAAARAIVAHDGTHLFLSPPFVAWLYAPLSMLSYRAALGVWTAVLLTQLAVAAALLSQWASAWSPAQQRLALLVALASAPTLDLFGSGQDTGLSLCLWIAGASLTARRKNAAAGLVWGLGWFKPQLFLIVPAMLVARRRWRVLPTYVAMSLALFALSLHGAGTRGFAAWRALLASATYHDFIVGEIGWKMQSLPALARMLVPASVHALAGAMGTAVGIVLAVRVLADAWNARRGDRADDELSWWAMACLATLVASPHLFLYDLVLAAFPCAVALWRGDAATRVIVAALLVVSWTGALRGVAFAMQPWPLRALGGGWSAVPLVVLMFHWRRRAIAASQR